MQRQHSSACTLTTLVSPSKFDLKGMSYKRQRQRLNSVPTLLKSAQFQGDCKTQHHAQCEYTLCLLSSCSGHSLLTSCTIKLLGKLFKAFAFFSLAEADDFELEEPVPKPAAVTKTDRWEGEDEEEEVKVSGFKTSFSFFCFFITCAPGLEATDICLV